MLTGGGEGEAGSAGSGEASQTWSAALLASTFGRIVVAIVGVALIGLAVDQARRGVTRTFMERISCNGGWPSETTIERVGTVGHLGRAVVVALLGVFVLVAVVQHDPEEVKGLDGSLRSVADATAGSLVLGLVAAGLAAYGLFSILAARCRRHSEG